MHMHVNVRLRHSELGMTAGRPSRSWRPTQNMKAGMSTIESMSILKVEGLTMFEVLLVMDLRDVSHEGWV